MNNLPPGCSESDIPGNRPEDLAYEAAAEHLLERLDKESVTPDEYPIVLAAGLAAVKAYRAAMAERAALDEEAAYYMRRHNENPTPND